VLVAPAMHPRMWDHPATRENLERISGHAWVRCVGPTDGPVASGDVGMGRMSEPGVIVQAIHRALTVKDLTGMRIVVTAGPTFEDIDPVRYIGNRSSGKMGFAIADRAAERGAHVTLIAGPVERSTPPGVIRINVRSAHAMRDALWLIAQDNLSGMDALIMTAAVADYRPPVVHDTKIKKSESHSTLELVRNPDIIAELGARREETSARPILVAFAVESGDDDHNLAYARAKLHQKRVDWVVTNDARDAFGGETNRAIIVGPTSERSYPTMAKIALADEVLNLMTPRSVAPKTAGS
jgi:phosphopantothenoylcysteine decarboxylase/phosphopantothenate--cysteine ligase